MREAAPDVPGGGQNHRRGRLDGHDLVDGSATPLRRLHCTCDAALRWEQSRQRWKCCGCLVPEGFPQTELEFGNLLYTTHVGLLSQTQDARWGHLASPSFGYKYRGLYH